MEVSVEQVQRLIRELQHTDIRARKEAARNLGRLSDGILFSSKKISVAPVVEALIKALGDTDGMVRHFAAEALGCFGQAAAQAVPALSELVGRKGSDSYTRCVVAQALGRIGPAAGPAVPALAAFLAEAVRTESWCVVEVLGRIGKAAVPALIEALRHSDPNTCRLAAHALGWIGPEAADSVTALITAMSHGDSGVRCDAAKALGGIGRPGALSAVPALTRALGDLTPYVCRAAERTLTVIERSASSAKSD